MSRSELYDWEWVIRLLCVDNADKVLAIAQDIYNTAFVRGKNYISLKQQPCEDCISREAVINILKEQYTHHAKEVERITGDAPYDYLTGLSDVIEDVQNLPSVTPDRPKGKWIEVEVHNCHATLKCSVCNRVIEPTFTFGEYSYEDIKTFYPYCHCGAEMNGGEEDDKGNS